MDVPIDLDPREVLEHLNALGYDNITKEQLKQFIKDLKKLIKHDLRKLQDLHYTEQENRPVERVNEQGQPSKNKLRTAGIQRRALAEHNQAKPTVERSTKSVQTIETSGDVGSSASSTVSTKTECASTLATQDSTAKKCSCKAVSCPCLRPKSAKPSTGKKENPPKPVSSFIRVVPSEARMGKTDPVTLYHYYQSVWARQNRPGENPHADVRWRIRHKMMAPTALRTNVENKRENPPWID